MLFQKYKEKPRLATKTDYIVVGIARLGILNGMPFILAVAISAGHFELTNAISSIINPVNSAEVKKKIRIWINHEISQIKKSQPEIFRLVPSGSIDGRDCLQNCFNSI